MLRMPTIVVTTNNEAACPTTPVLKLAGPSGDVPLGNLYYGNDTSCSGSTDTLSAQPTTDLLYDTAYTLQVQGVMDGQGNTAAGCQVTFTVKSKTAAIWTTGDESLALDTDGTLWTWGNPIGAMIGTGDQTIPHRVDLGGKVVAAAIADGLALGALADGTVMAWGDNQYGQLGRGTSADSDTSLGKVLLSLPSGVTVTALSVSPDHCLALRSDGKVMAWGRDDSGELGDGQVGVVDGTPPRIVSTPIEVPGLNDVVGIVAASGSTGHGVYDGAFSLAVAKDGTVWGWGSNAFGAIDQLLPYPPPDNYDPRYSSPTKTLVSQGKTIAGGLDQAYALLSDGTVRAWEWNFDASLGDGTCQDCMDCDTAATYQPPRTVLAASGPLDQVVAISAGNSYAMAVRSDGSVWGWGNNNLGQLGDGTQGVDVNCNTSWPSVSNLQGKPEQIPQLTGAVGVAAGSGASLILKGDGSVWAAGYNANNALGVGSSTNTLLFAKVPGL